MLKISISPKVHGMTFPKNLDSLPEWLIPEMGLAGVNGDCPAVVGLTIARPLTYALAEELWELRSASALTLANSDKTEEDRGLPMCSTLEYIFAAARGAVIKVLARGSYEVTNGKYILGTCLEESPHGKRFLHNLHGEGRDRYTYASLLGEEGRKTAAEVAEWIKPRAEEWARSLENVYSALDQKGMAASYLTGCR